MEVLPSNQSNLILTLLLSSITDIIWDFVSSLCCCGLSEHDAVQQESSRYFGHCQQFQLIVSCLVFFYLYITCVDALYSVK